ncbi:MAG: hypothetical protein GC178_12140 [Flavobacteriales bacterium]|nr:hypothetical protein [Flavobacteriales bacterium]
MKSTKYTPAVVLFFVLVFSGFMHLGASAQTSIDNEIDKRNSERSVEGARLGSLVCEDANGKLTLCSGSVEETVAGIATNVPYITLNKPASPDGSKYIFQALVSDQFGSISKGDALKAVSDGKLGKCSVNETGYAIALEDSKGKEVIKVKVLK